MLPPTALLYKNLLKSVILAPKLRDIPVFSGWKDVIFKQGDTEHHKPIPKIIWIFWDDKDKPALVQATIEQAKRMNPDHTVNVLDNTNISDFFPDDFLKNSNVQPQYKSDLVRLELLERYGGIWMDATCILNESLQWIQDANTQHSADLIGFYRNRDTVDHQFPVLENWFLAAPSNTDFIKEWKKEIQKIVSIGPESYYTELQSRPDYKEIAQNIQRPDYLVTYLAAQIVMRKTPPNLYLRRAEDGPLLYQEAIKWDRERIAAILCRIKAPSPIPPIIKLTHSNRYLLPLMIRLKLVRPDSILGRFLAVLKR
ncbi:glycosyltransferase family 32 protein [Acetobacter sp.]|uniref:glycosyltransferase family 32 protein n=1 Tax=Acetobacter sp. TaxID=440 RepID=UPI0039E93555